MFIIALANSPELGNTKIQKPNANQFALSPLKLN